MANLQKIVKVTQSQYNTLASGETVGSYTGLDDNYIYLIEDTNTYITSDGGTIDGGSLHLDGQYLSVDEGHGIHIYDSNNDNNVAICSDYNGNEIIYSSHSSYKPFFVDIDYALIYSDNEDYWQDFTFNTKQLRVHDADDTTNTIYLDTETGEIVHSENAGTNWYSATLPSKSGTIALTSDIPSVSLTTTTGSESITVGSDTLNVVTRDTAQTIDGQKTFSSYPIAKGITLKNNVLNPTGSNFEIANDNGYNGKIRFGGKGLMFTGGNVLPSENNNSQKLGDTAYKWKAVYIDGYLGKQNANYGVSLPDMTNWTANKELATTDAIPQVQRFI